MKELVVVSAVAFEVHGVLEALKKHSISHQYYELGIGPLNALKKAIELKKFVSGKDVLFVGSAGTFGPFLEPYLVQASKVHWAPTAERMGLAKDMQLHPCLSINSCRLDLPKVEVLTSTSVSFEDSFREPVGDCNLFVENMELYPVIQEFNESANRIDVLFGITNKVGPSGSKEWVKNFKIVSQLQGKFIQEHIYAN